jgi:hypothetical protein
VIFWSLAQLYADRNTAKPARYAERQRPPGGRMDEDGDPAMGAGDVARWVMADPESLALAVRQGHELGAPARGGGGGEPDPSADAPPRRITAEPAAPAIEDSEHGLRLGPTVPNPARSGCTIRFTLVHDARASLTIHDLAGRLVRTVLDRPLPAGAHAVSWDGRGQAGEPIPAGLYFLRLTANQRSASMRIVVTR